MRKGRLLRTPGPSVATLRKLWMSYDPKDALELARKLQRAQMAFLEERES